MARASQEDRILQLLRSNGVSWTPAPRLSEISLQYCARLYSLRKQGVDIQNKVEVRNGVRHGFYRLRRSVLIAVQPQVHASTNPPLFRDLTERHVGNG